MINPCRLRVGESITFTAHGRTFTLKKLVRDIWHLRDHGIGERSRFGNLKQIREDIAIVEQYGTLPGGDKGRW